MRMLGWCAVMTALIAGCGGGDMEGTGDGAAPLPSGDTCPGEMPIAYDTPVRGETGEGWDVELGGWFQYSNVACTPWGGDFPGPYQVYGIDIPPHTEWDIVLQPDEGVDVELVAWMQGTSDPSCYPLRDIGVVTCETSNYGRAGEEEYVWLNAINNPYHVVVLVLTAPGSAPGGYELRVVDHRRDG